MAEETPPPKVPSVFCMFCRTAVKVPDFGNHEISSEHQTVVKKKLEEINVGSMMCKACVVPVNSEVIWSSHSHGKNHNKQVNILHKVGKTNLFTRPYSLIKFDKDNTDPISDDMFSEVPDLFAPISSEEPAPLPVSTANNVTKPTVEEVNETISDLQTGPMMLDQPKPVDPDPPIKSVEARQHTPLSNRHDYYTTPPFEDYVELQEDIIPNKRKRKKRRSTKQIDKDDDEKLDLRNLLNRDRWDRELKPLPRDPEFYKDYDRGGLRAESDPRDDLYRGPRYEHWYRDRRRDMERHHRREYDRDHRESRRSRRGDDYNRRDYDRHRDSERRRDDRRDDDERSEESKSSETTKKSEAEGDSEKKLDPVSSLHLPFHPPPLFPPLGTMFPSIDPYASTAIPFNPSLGIPPMPMPPMPIPPMFLPPTSLTLPMPPTSLALPMPPTSMALPMPPTSMALPMPPGPMPPHHLLQDKQPDKQADEESDDESKEDVPDRSHIDNTPITLEPLNIEQKDVEIFIPEFFASRYENHPHHGVVNANPEIAIAKQADQEKLKKYRIPDSIHRRMATKPIVILKEPLKPHNPDEYPSLKGQVLPIIKPNQKFIVIGSNCLRVTGPNHFSCDLCKFQFNDSNKSEHLLAKSHLLNILWNWDPDSAQMIKDLELVNSALFEKKIMEAAQEIQKKEIKLLSENQLRVRARILDQNNEEQNKYFVNNEIFDPQDFPNHDLSYLNKVVEKEEPEEADEFVLEDDPKKSNKTKILEAGILNMLKSSDQTDIICDEDTATATLGICTALVKQLEVKFRGIKHAPSEDITDKLGKIKHFFGNLVIIQQILDVYPSTAPPKEKEQPREPAPAPPNPRLNSESYIPLSSSHDVMPPHGHVPHHDVMPPHGHVPHHASAFSIAAYPAALSSSGGHQHSHSVADPRRSKQAEGYSIYSTSIDQAGLEWYRNNKA